LSTNTIPAPRKHLTTVASRVATLSLSASQPAVATHPCTSTMSFIAKGMRCNGLASTPTRSSTPDAFAASNRSMRLSVAYMFPYGEISPDRKAFESAAADAHEKSTVINSTVRCALTHDARAFAQPTQGNARATGIQAPQISARKWSQFSPMTFLIRPSAQPRSHMTRVRFGNSPIVRKPSGMTVTPLPGRTGTKRFA